MNTYRRLLFTFFTTTIILSCCFIGNVLGLSSSSNNNNIISRSGTTDLPDIRAAVIVPGFLSGVDDFQELAESLTARGIPTVTVPMPRWHWIPCLGGRSMRPILDRIDFTVRHLAGSGGDISAVPKRFEYNVLDCWADFQDNPGGVFEVGGSADVDQYPQNINPRGNFEVASQPKGRVALIGHSAGGWISRLYLSYNNYGGKVYGGQDLVHSLVTLGTPHRDAPGPAFKSVEWCNRQEPQLPPSVRGLAVGGTGFLGDGSAGTFSKNSYAFCCPDGTDGSQYNGDGVTPIESALAMDGHRVDRLNLHKVHHFPWSEVFGAGLVAPDLTELHRNGMPWYGSDDAVDKWVGWLEA